MVLVSPIAQSMPKGRAYSEQFALFSLQAISQPWLAHAFLAYILPSAKVGENLPASLARRHGGQRTHWKPWYTLLSLTSFFGMRWALAQLLIYDGMLLRVFGMMLYGRIVYRKQIPLRIASASLFSMKCLIVTGILTKASWDSSPVAVSVCLCLQPTSQLFIFMFRWKRWPTFL